MSGIEDFRRTEIQANYFVALAKMDDIHMIEQGHGKLVDMWETEKLCIDGVAVIYGLQDTLNRKPGL